MHLTAKFHHPTFYFNRWEVIVLTNRQTDKQTPLKTSTWISSGQIPLRYPGRRQVRGWSQTCSELEFGLHERASRSATSLGNVCDQDSVMEFGLDQLRTGLQPGSSRFKLSRHVQIARPYSNLVPDRFEAKFHYAILVADLVADLQRAGIWPITPYLGR